MAATGMEISLGIQDDFGRDRRHAGTEGLLVQTDFNFSLTGNFRVEAFNQEGNGPRRKCPGERQRIVFRQLRALFGEKRLHQLIRGKFDVADCEFAELAAPALRQLGHIQTFNGKFTQAIGAEVNNANLPKVHGDAFIPCRLLRIDLHALDAHGFQSKGPVDVKHLDQKFAFINLAAGQSRIQQAENVHIRFDHGPLSGRDLVDFHVDDLIFDDIVLDAGGLQKHFRFRQGCCLGIEKPDECAQIVTLVKQRPYGGLLGDRFTVDRILESDNLRETVRAIFADDPIVEIGQAHVFKFLRGLEDGIRVRAIHRKIDFDDGLVDPA